MPELNYLQTLIQQTLQGLPAMPGLQQGLNRPGILPPVKNNSFPTLEHPDMPEGKPTTPTPSEQTAAAAAPGNTPTPDITTVQNKTNWLPTSSRFGGLLQGLAMASERMNNVKTAQEARDTQNWEMQQKINAEFAFKNQQKKDEENSPKYLAEVADIEARTDLTKNQKAQLIEANIAKAKEQTIGYEQRNTGVYNPKGNAAGRSGTPGANGQSELTTAFDSDNARAMNDATDPTTGMIDKEKFIDVLNFYTEDSGMPNTKEAKRSYAKALESIDKHNQIATGKRYSTGALWQPDGQGGFVYVPPVKKSTADIEEEHAAGARGAIRGQVEGIKSLDPNSILAPQSIRPANSRVNDFLKKKGL